MADELRKDRSGIDPVRVPGTKEHASRENDVLAGDEDLAQRKTEHVRVPGATERAAHRGPNLPEEGARGERNESHEKRQREPDREAP